MYFLIKNEEFLEKYSKNWGKKISIIIKNKFNSKPVYNKKYLIAENKSTKIKVFNVFILQ